VLAIPLFVAGDEPDSNEPFFERQLRVLKDRTTKIDLPAAAPGNKPVVLRDKEDENSAAIRMRKCRRVRDERRA
jgi:hypothetical protein